MPENDNDDYNKTCFDSDGHCDTIKNVNPDIRDATKDSVDANYETSVEHETVLNENLEHFIEVNGELDEFFETEDGALYNTVDEIEIENSRLTLLSEMNSPKGARRVVETVKHGLHPNATDTTSELSTFSDPSELYATVNKVKTVGVSPKSKKIDPPSRLLEMLVNDDQKKSISPKTKKIEAPKQLETNTKLQMNGPSDVSMYTNGGSQVGQVIKTDVSHRKVDRIPPPVPPRMPIHQLPKADINSNSLKSLGDLIAYNRLQQQKVSYKGNAKVAPPPPPKVPETTMVTKTASQRSIIITYL